jgi:hypothetical protein
VRARRRVETDALTTALSVIGYARTSAKQYPTSTSAIRARMPPNERRMNASTDVSEAVGSRRWAGELISQAALFASPTISAPASRISSIASAPSSGPTLTARIAPPRAFTLKPSRNASSTVCLTQ